MSNKDAKNEIDADALRYARDSVSREFDHRRNQIWRIFAWAANLLIAIIGVVIALTAQESFTFMTIHRWLLTLTIAIITAHATVWIAMQSRFKQNVEEVVELYDEKLSIMHQLPNAKQPFGSDMFGYILTLGLLSIAVTLTIWIVPE